MGEKQPQIFRLRYASLKMTVETGPASHPCDRKNGKDGAPGRLGRRGIAGERRLILLRRGRVFEVRSRKAGIRG